METYQLPMQNLQNIGRFPVEAILQSPLYVSFLGSLLRHTNPSMLVVAEGYTCSSKSAAFSRVFA